MKPNIQTWIVAPGIGQCPAKNWVMSDKGCFIMDRVVQCEVKIFLLSYIPTS